MILKNISLLYGNNLRFIESSDVKISNKGLGYFKNTDRELEYWIATETT